MTLTWGWDATHSNLSGVPAGQGAGYTTGTPDIRWTPEDWDAHPGAVRIDQDAADSDPSADVLDVETGAATPASVPGWTDRAYDDYESGARPGQRVPAVYCSLSVVQHVADALVANPSRFPPKLWVAHWGITMDDAAALIGTQISGLTVVGVQFANRGAFDSDVFDSAWLAAVSDGPTIAPTPPSSTALQERLTTMPELAQGATGGPVRTLQGLLVARGYRLGNTGTARDGIDGDFGALTHAAVVAFQEFAHIAADGIVGPITWPLLPIS
jgi:hypothetical protein